MPAPPLAFTVIVPLLAALHVTSVFEDVAVGPLPPETVTEAVAEQKDTSFTVTEELPADMFGAVPVVAPPVHVYV